MKIKEITDVIEEYAPLALQEPYDNAGLLTGNPNDEVDAALVCVDATEDIVNEAITYGAGLIIAHHPVVFHPLRTLAGGSNVEAVVMHAIRHNIAIYAAHTNLDRAPKGMSHVLAKLLELNDISVLAPEANGAGFGAIGMLNAPTGALEFLHTVATRLNIDCIRHNTPPRLKIQKIALSTGAGGDSLERAIAAGADAFLTADLKHDRFLAASGQILLADIGHFESEFCAIDLICDIISKKITNFALHKSENSQNPVKYLKIF